MFHYRIANYLGCSPVTVLRSMERLLKAEVTGAENSGLPSSPVQEFYNFIPPPLLGKLKISATTKENADG